MNKILTDEKRKNAEYCFAVVDATIAQYGKAVLDCGCETDGSHLAHFIRNGVGLVTCHKCYDTKYRDGKEIVESIRKEFAPCRHCKNFTKKTR